MKRGKPVSKLLCIQVAADDNMGGALVVELSKCLLTWSSQCFNLI